MLIIIQGVMIALVGVVISIVFSVFAWAIPVRECLKSHTEEYHSSTGTSLWAVTGNASYTTLNDDREEEVCDEYGPSRHKWPLEK